ELANAVKPAVLPGEAMTVQVLREGKEPGQGVAYLDDGTMVVIEQAKRSIGQTVDVVVTSVLQTPSGRMIFTRTRDDAPSAVAAPHRRGRARRGRGGRRDLRPADHRDGQAGARRAGGGDARPLGALGGPDAAGLPRRPLREAHEKARRDGVVGTDDAMLVERLGHPVRVVPGLPENVKITTPEDLRRARRGVRP